MNWVEMNWNVIVVGLIVVGGCVTGIIFALRRLGRDFKKEY